MSRCGRARPAPGHRRRAWPCGRLGRFRAFTKGEGRPEIVRPMPDTSRTRPEPLFAAKDVAAEMARWLAHLGAERRMSGKTLEAYERDVRQFLSFLAEHLGGMPSLK